MTTLRWHHAQIGCYGQWLPGDPRGFRSRDHDIHSSGDYRNPPPRGEHAGLHRYAQAQLTQPPVTLNESHRAVVGAAILRWFEIQDSQSAAIAVHVTHVHLLCALPPDAATAVMGRIKKYASQRLTQSDSTVPRHVFAKGGVPKIVRDRSYFENVYRYIVEKHAAEGAWVWGVGWDAVRQISV